VATTGGRIKAISISQRKGTPKRNVPAAELHIDYGIVGDAHAGRGHRQVSLLAFEAIEIVRAEGANVSPGDFAENLTIEGFEWPTLRVGCKLRIGGCAELEVTQRGKQCHGRCAIFHRLGDCIMPREGVFARVTHSGFIKVGDCIEVLDDHGCRADG
jgi:MOSC domain-containing protein YiiM